MFCQGCGNKLEDGAKFCPTCGKVVQIEQQPTAFQTPAYSGNGAVRQGIPAPGFSDRVNHPEILAAVKKNRKAAKVFAFILVPLPIIGFIVYSLVSEKMKLSNAALYGGIISAIFLLFALISFIKGRASNTYDAVVSDKKSSLEYRHENNEDSERVMKYMTVVLTTDGKKKKIVEWEGSQIVAYNYLNVGDRFRYHPQFNFPYELYDKSTAQYIACVSCGTKNPVEADRCQKCGLPLLK